MWCIGGLGRELCEFAWGITGKAYNLLPIIVFGEVFEASISQLSELEERQ